MASFVYVLCMLTACLCAVLLLRSYSRLRHRLLLWSGLCFAALTVSNLVMVLDLVVFPDVDLSPTRSALSLVAVSLLLYGLIWEDK